MMGIFAGYASATSTKRLKGDSGRSARSHGIRVSRLLGTFLTLIVAVLLRFYRAVPVASLVSLLALWFGVQCTFSDVGAYLGYSGALAYPTITSNIPREVPTPQPWYLSVWFTTTVGGILPFGACFVELFFILSSMWMDQYYYVFGFTGLVFIILVATCCEITIVLCYFQLCSENHRWWWRSFLTSGSTAFYVFAYSVDYFRRLGADEWFTYVLYFGYMGLICIGLFLLTGTCGFLACLWFTKKIYASIKVD